MNEPVIRTAKHESVAIERERIAEGREGIAAERELLTHEREGLAARREHLPEGVQRLAHYLACADGSYHLSCLLAKSYPLTQDVRRLGRR